jgi:hypothetical protein
VQPSSSPVLELASGGSRPVCSFTRFLLTRRFSRSTSANPVMWRARSAAPQRRLMPGPCSSVMDATQGGIPAAWAFAQCRPEPGPAPPAMVLACRPRLLWRPAAPAPGPLPCERQHSQPPRPMRSDPQPLGLGLDPPSGTPPLWHRQSQVRRLHARDGASGAPPARRRRKRHSLHPSRRTSSYSHHHSHSRSGAASSYSHSPQCCRSIAAEAAEAVLPRAATAS